MGRKCTQEGIYVYVCLIRLTEQHKLIPHCKVTVLCLVAQSCPTLCNPMDSVCRPGSSVRGDSPGKNTGMGCHALLQGNFPTQGSNPGFPHCRRILYHLSQQESNYTPIKTFVKKLSHLCRRSPSRGQRPWLVTPEQELFYWLRV